ncbi:hypothetical protein ACFYYM_31435 [Streptomyces erythrochromogenes]|uniref:hypothetical protein n=1 Tax=Streptomyces erythrochromogenes TaxID=285574 RepID=UPI00368FF5A5
MTYVLTEGHVHDHSGPDDDRRGSVVPRADEELKAGARVGVVAQLFDTELDECELCREIILGFLAEDPATTGVLIHWTCWITSETYGGFPAILLDPEEQDDCSFQATEPLMELAQTYRRTSVHAAEALAVQCAAFTAGQRLEAARSAVQLVVGLRDFGVDFPY